MRAGNKATERGRTSGKSRTQPPGGGSAGQTTTANSRRPGTRQRHTGGKNAGAPVTKSAATAVSRARTASPAHGAARRTQKKTSEQAKYAFALLPARRAL